MSYEEIEPDPGPLAYCLCGNTDGSNFMCWTNDLRWVCRACWRREHPTPSRRGPMPKLAALRRRIA